MNESDIEKEAKEEAKKIEHEDHDSHKSLKDSPFNWLIGLFMAFLIILLIVPFYGIKLDPHPSNIPSLSDVTFLLGNETGTKLESPTIDEYKVLVSPNSPKIKLIADRIATQSCDSSKICNAKAMFYFVRNNFEYVNDPRKHEYVKDAVLALQSEGGDCDDASVLLATLLEAVGIKTRFVFIPGHVYVEAFLPNSLNKYRDKQGWVTLDATCHNCKFGDIPYSTSKAQKVYIST